MQRLQTLAQRVRLLCCAQGQEAPLRRQPEVNTYNLTTPYGNLLTSHSTGAQRISQPSLAAPLAARPTAKAADDVVTRLDRIEAALEGLATAIANLTTSHQQPSEAPTPRSRASAATKGSSPSDHPTASLVSLDDASDQLRRIREQTESTKEQDDASHNLQDLATAMTTITLKGLSPSTHDTAAHGGFFVPTKAVGYTLMGRKLSSLFRPVYDNADSVIDFLNVMELADIMTLRPPDDLLHRVIFEPQHVSQSAWIVTINFVLYAMSSKDKDAELAPSFRNNARLALDDANIYLAPSEANIQMLLLLASHADEFASPNLSWMLLGHACRQAQALGLNSPDSDDEGTRQRQLCLFWALFMVDKSCALAFGRPCFLPTRLYGDCEMPEEAHLRKYRPHLGPTDQARTSQFGMHFWMQSLQMAKVAGSILDLDAQATEEDMTLLQAQLEACHDHTQHVSYVFHLLYDLVLTVASSCLQTTPASCPSARRSKAVSSSWASRRSSSITCTYLLSCSSAGALRRMRLP